MASNRTPRRLRAPPGTDEANFGTEKYRVGNSGTITVPTEAADPLIDRGGFVDVTEDEPVVVADPAAPVLETFTAVSHQFDPAASFSFGGETYTADANGVIQAPNDAVAQIGAHGFTPVATPTS